MSQPHLPFIVRIWRCVVEESNNKVVKQHIVGVGFLVTKRYVFTCAHVAAAALEIAPSTQERPEKNVYLDFPFINDASAPPLKATIKIWVAVQPDGGGDVAGLEIIDDLPVTAKPATLRSVNPKSGPSIRAYGFPKTAGMDGQWIKADLKEQLASGLVQFKLQQGEFPVEAGFSGAPVYIRNSVTVIGIIKQGFQGGDVDAGRMIPAETLLETWSEAKKYQDQMLLRQYASIFGLLATLLVIFGLIFCNRPQPTLEESAIGVVVAYSTLSDSIDAQAVDDVLRDSSAELESTLSNVFQLPGLAFDYLHPWELTCCLPWQVRRVEGNDRAERERSATDIAQAYEADIVIYVTAEQVGNRVTLEIEYYLSPTSTFIDADEISGTFSIGNKILFTPPFTDPQNVEALRRTLIETARSLAYTVVGMVEYALENYDEALNAVQCAQGTAVGVCTAANSPRLGVTYILLGNIYLGRADQFIVECEEELDREQLFENYNLAEEAFMTANELMPDYSRPYIGLAIVSYERALYSDVYLCGEVVPPNSTFLDQADNYIAQAQSVQAPEELGLRARALILEARIAFVRCHPSLDEVIENQQDCTRFIDITNRVLQMYNDGELGAHAASEVYINRGQHSSWIGDFADCVTFYGSAFDILGDEPSPRMMVAYQEQGYCFWASGDLEAAHRSYDNARMIAIELGSDDDISDYADIIAEIDSTATAIAEIDSTATAPAP